MEKNTILKVISITVTIVAILALVCAVTVTGSGFLDLSNLVKAVFIGVAVICGILAVVAWKCSKATD